jgi:PKD repeat protein
MKKLVLLSLVSLISTFIWATDPQSKTVRKALPPLKINPSRLGFANNKPKSLRSGTLQTVPIGKAGNVLSVLNANCHQIDVDSALNTVLFIHRSDTVFGTSYNVAQYRYDISKNGGTTWTSNIGPLNPIGDNITVNGRYPECVLRPDSAYATIPDSAWIVYNGSWHNGGTTDRWQGQFYGVGRLDGDTSTYTQHDDIVNNANVEISTSMIKTAHGDYWNLNLDYTSLSTTTDTIRGIILEHGLWNDSAGEVLWTYLPITINTNSIYTNGTAVGNNLGSPIISFDPTGKYGWIVMYGNLGTSNNLATMPIYMNSSDYGQTWSTPQELYLENLPGMFTTGTSTTQNLGKTIPEDLQVVVDSAGNPHIITVVGIADTTSNLDEFYLQPLVLYDLYYNPSVASCSWQANSLALINGYSGYYTSDQVGDANRIQVSRSKDGTKIFAFWTDTDSTTVAGILAAGGTTIESNPYPNLFGMGIDMTTRNTTNAIDFTAGDPLFGGIVTGLYTTGTIGGAILPVVSPNAVNEGAGAYNVPVVLTNPDYLQTITASKSSVNPASFYYAQNINFTSSEYVNKFDNAAPTLTVNGPDTVYVHIDSTYTPPTATAYDCQTGNITPQYSSTVPINGGGYTDSSGVFISTWSATSNGNTSTATQVVIVSGPPTAIIWDSVTQNDYILLFKDESLNFPTTRYWSFGDGSHSTAASYSKHYLTDGTKMVTLLVTNQYGSSSDTVYIDVTNVGINEIELSNKINVYPNPSNGIITVQMADDIAKGAKVSVFNILGQNTNNNMEIKPNVTITELNLSHLETGAYMLKIETPAGTAIKPIVINK